MHQSALDIIRSIPLSNDTVSRRIDEMAIDVENQLIDILRVIEFSLQLDESTFHDNEALLLPYVRFTKDGVVFEKLLFARSLVTDTREYLVYLKLFDRFLTIIIFLCRTLLHALQRSKLLIIAFPTSYLVEKGFSTVMGLHTKQRNRLDIVKNGDLRLMLTNFEPDVAKLAGDHQPQGSH